MSERLKRKLGDMLVATTAMGAIAHVLMRRTMLTPGGEAEIEAIRDAVVRKLKNADIENFDYEQQAKLVTRSLETVDRFFDHFKSEIQKTEGS